jgi:hypothetical protein
MVRLDAARMDTRNPKRAFGQLLYIFKKLLLSNA